MASSSFKSTSKRATDLSSKNERNPNRSKSVTPLSRTNAAASSSPSNLSLPDDLFSNKRDNPLYCCSSSSSSSASPINSNSEKVKEGSLNEASSSSSRRRGRSVSRSSGAGSQNEKLGGERRRLRSVSRGHYGNSVFDIGHQYKCASSLRNKENGKSVTSRVQPKRDASAKEFGAKERTKNLQTWTSRHSISEFSDASSSSCQARNWEDGISTSSFSERDIPPANVDSDAIYETVRSEVRRAVFEFRDDFEDALWSKDPSIHTSENIIDIPPEFLDPEELVCDEYVSKLEQAQERARKLRADLAVEEQREQELSRIVNHIIHAPTSLDSQKSRPKRRVSMERVRMSRQLAEEAMTYFDECVSISTFESSDFSSLEDPQPSSSIGIPHMGSSRFFHHDNANHHEEVDNQAYCFVSLEGSNMSLAENTRISFAHDHDIRQYIKKFEKGPKGENLEHGSQKSRYSSDEYDLSAKSEILVFEAFHRRNRIEYGGLLLCHASFPAYA